MKFLILKLWLGLLLTPVLPLLVYYIRPEGDIQTTINNLVLVFIAAVVSLFLYCIFGVITIRKIGRNYPGTKWYIMLLAFIPFLTAFIALLYCILLILLGA